MRVKGNSLVSLLKDVMQRRKIGASHMAAELKISHTTVGRWLSGKWVPSISSCVKLSEYSGVPLSTVLSAAGHIPASKWGPSAEWPEFRSYCSGKYPGLLEEDLIDMIEDLIEKRRRRGKRGTVK